MRLSHFSQLKANAVAVLLLLGLLPACADGDELPTAVVPIEDVVVHTSFSDDVTVNPKWVALPAVGLGYVWPEERALPPEQRTDTRVVDLSADQPFDPLLILQSPEERVVLLTAVVNYEQVAFALDGQWGLLHEVTVPPDGDLEIPMRIELQGAGLHDLMVIAFVDPYNDAANLAEQGSMNPRLAARRATVIVEGSEAPAAGLPAPLTGSPVPGDVSLNLGATLVRAAPAGEGHPSDMDRQFYTETVRPDADFRYQLWISNLDGDTAVSYAVLLFHDFRQVAVDGAAVAHVNLNVDEEILIDAETRLPPAAGVNQLQLIYVRDPYQVVAQRSAPVRGSPRIILYAGE